MRSLSKNEWAAVAVSVILVGFTVFGQIVWNFFRSGGVSGDEKGALGIPDSGDEIKAQDVLINEIKVGEGQVLASGMTVAVNYVLRLSDGTLIQDSKLVNNGAPFSFIYGAGGLIPGWELGLAGMRVGGKRIIVIPPKLGYGSQDVGPIPANSTLIFEIEVVSLQSTQ